MGNISILLADDSITIQKVVGIIFAGEGYTLTVVDNGAAAVQKAQELLPDVLLIDVLMPGMSGYEVCESLRANPALTDKPILLLTGSFEAFDEAKAKSCGADDHITKPFESQQIIAKVKELYALGQRRAAGAPPAAVPEPEAFVVPAPAFEPADQPAQAAVSPDDPWGAFTQQPAAAPAFEPDTLEVNMEQPDVLAMVSEEPPAFAVERADDANIGASWVPVEEQTFEFEEQVAEPPAAVLEVEQPVVAPEEPPVAAIAPVAMAAGAVALSEDQLRQALMSASKETIERIVWEVVPDLAEALIKETIRRITDGK
ncbi:MAG: response regulator [Trichlorobacter sp.]